MNYPGWILALLFTVCFTLATRLELWYQNWAGNRAQSGSLAGVLLGDSRRMFANHFFVEADVYFHGGYYPSVFDQAGPPKALHITENESAADQPKTAELDDLPVFLQKPRDWIDALGRNFYPTKHVHPEKTASEQEILPWLLFSSELDPNNVQTYTVGAYWLRKMGKVEQAEQFLRAGLRANPLDPELLFELGRIYQDDRHDTERARNTWEAALHQWQTQTASQAEPDRIFLAKVTTHLARLEEGAGNFAKSIFYLKILKPVAANPQFIQQQIDDLEKKIRPR